MATPDLTALLSLAEDVARDAGDLLRSYAERRSLRTETKTSLTDPVSEADHAAERLITERLLAVRPDDGMLGEEDAADRAGTSGLRWVVDPLDGTVNFLYHHPQWCVSIACEDADGALVGVVHDPVRGETFTAVRGGGARLGERELAVTEVADLGRTLVATGFAYDPAVRRDQGRLAADLLGTVRDLRRGGSAALDLAWTAAGRVDAYLEHGLNPWDWAAGRLLVVEAGGVVTPHERVLGGEARAGMVAGGRVAHDLLLAWLDGALTRRQVTTGSDGSSWSTRPVAARTKATGSSARSAGRGPPRSPSSTAAVTSSANGDATSSSPSAARRSSPWTVTSNTRVVR